MWRPNRPRILFGGIVLCLVPTLWAASTAAAEAVELTAAQEQAITRFVRSQERVRSRRDPARNRIEYREGRRYAAGDVTGDGVADLAAQYTTEEGNNYRLFLVVFDGRSLKPLDHTRVGGKGLRDAELRRVVDRVVEIDTRDYAESDAACCPSVVGTTRYQITRGRLHEIVGRKR